MKLTAKQNCSTKVGAQQHCFCHDISGKEFCQFWNEAFSRHFFRVDIG